MNANALADKVFEARNARHLTITALARSCGMSPRTLVKIEAASERTYRSTTLEPLDRYFGWAPGEAWRAWKTAEPQRVDASIIDAVAKLNERLDRLEERPAWADDLVNSCRLLTAGDRAMLIGLAGRLVDKRTTPLGLRSVHG